MRLFLAIAAVLLLSQGVMAYTQNGVTVTGSHANVTSMGPYDYCIACHATNTGQWIVAHSYTSWVKRTQCVSYNGYTCVKTLKIYTTVDRHRNYTAFFIGFSQGPDNPKVQICLACHNATTSRLSTYTSARYNRRANPIDSATHARQAYSPKRSTIVFWPRTTVEPLFSHSIGWDTNKARPKLSPIKNWDGRIRQQPKTRFGKGSNFCMDCHWPHQSSKANYLR